MLRGSQAQDCRQHPCAGVIGEPQPDLEIHQPALFATFQRLYQEHVPLAFRLASPETGSQRVTVTVQDSDDKEVGVEQSSRAVQGPLAHEP